MQITSAIHEVEPCGANPVLNNSLSQTYVVFNYIILGKCIGKRMFGVFSKEKFKELGAFLSGRGSKNKRKSNSEGSTMSCGRSPK
jgi:hypothetical protein